MMPNFIFVQYGAPTWQKQSLHHYEDDLSCSRGPDLRRLTSVCQHNTFSWGLTHFNIHSQTISDSPVFRGPAIAHLSSIKGLLLSSEYHMGFHPEVFVLSAAYAPINTPTHFSKRILKTHTAFQRGVSTRVQAGLNPGQFVFDHKTPL